MLLENKIISASNKIIHFKKANFYLQVDEEQKAAINDFFLIDLLVK